MTRKRLLSVIGGSLAAAGIAIALAPATLAHPPRIPRTVRHTPSGPSLPAAVHDALYSGQNPINPAEAITSATEASDGTWTVCVHAFVPRFGAAPTTPQTAANPHPLVGKNTLCFLVPPGAKSWTYAYDSGPVGPPQ